MGEFWKNTFNIEPLNGKNYDAWKFRVRTLLMEQELDEMIQKEYRDSDYDDANKRDEARKKDNKGKLIIVQCISDSQLEFVRDEDTAYQMWRNLETIYEKKGLAEQLFCKKKLMSLKMRENEDLDEFIARFDELMQKLEATGAVIKDDDAVCNLLLALPKSYKTVVRILENMPIESLSLDVAKAKLKDETEKRKLNKPDNGDECKPLASCSNKSGGDGSDISDTSSIHGEPDLACIQDQEIEEDKARAEATFRYTVENVSRMKEPQLSPAYYVRNLPWKIKVMQKSNQLPMGQHLGSLGFFLECNCECKSPPWRCHATAELRLLSCKSHGKPFTRNIPHTFSNEEYDWGYSQFMLWKDVIDPDKGFIKDDSITLEVYVTADEPVYDEI